MKFQKINLDNYVKPSKFLKWQPGDNRVRVLTDGYIYRVVGKKTARGFVRAIVGDGEIPEFLKDAEPKLTYGFVVYSFDTGHFHVVETGPTLGDMLVKLLQQMPDKQYQTKDIIVHKTGEKLETTYTVKYADTTEKLPEGANKTNPELGLMLRNFEE